MAFTPVNGIEPPISSKNITNFIQENNEQLSHHSHVVIKGVENSVQVKRKRGRPKKIVLENENQIQIASNIIDKDFNNSIGNKSKTISDIDNDCLMRADLLANLKSNDSTLPSIVPKRGRGRPRKNTSNMVDKAKIESVVNTPKKESRKKRSINLIEQTNDSTLVKSDENFSSTCSNSNEINFADTETINKYSVISEESEIQFKKCIVEYKSISENNFTHVTTKVYDNCTEIEKTDSTKQTNTTESLIDGPDLLFQINDTDCNSVFRQKRSKSLDSDHESKTRHRKNSLSDNFVFGSFDGSTITNTNNRLNKFWKSLSYLEGGPNYLIERYQRNELNKKFRSELKRSRSFPNCMLLDTVIWRFLVYQQIYNSDESFVELSDAEKNLINELPENGNHHEYRSKSEPICDLPYKKDEINYCLSKSFNNLNILGCDNLSIISSQTSLNVSDLNDSTKNEAEDSDGKIRRSKRLNTKTKDSDNVLEEKRLLESNKPKFDYLLYAAQIREENERQLLEARKNDPELEEKLSKLNFTFISTNLFRPHR